MENKRKAIDYFWIISRGLLIIMCFYPLFNVSKNASLLSNIINGSSLIYIILMIIVFKDEILKKKKKNKLKLYTGVLSLMYGVVMSITVIKFSTNIFDADVDASWYAERFKIFLLPFLLMIVLCVWMILFGIYDLRNRKMI